VTWQEKKDDVRTLKDRAAMWVERTIFSLGLSAGAPLRIALVVSPCE
jgi:hypothetical protein